MVDAVASKAADLIGRAGSSPALSTIKDFMNSNIDWAFMSAVFRGKNFKYTKYCNEDPIFYDFISVLNKFKIRK